MKLNLRYWEKILSIENTDHIPLKLSSCYVITCKHVNRNCHYLIIYAQRKATASLKNPTGTYALTKQTSLASIQDTDVQSKWTTTDGHLFFFLEFEFAFVAIFYFLNHSFKKKKAIHKSHSRLSSGYMQTFVWQ